MATSISDAELALALKTRLRSLLPWWYRFDLTLDSERVRMSHRVLRLGFPTGWGHSAWSRETDTDADDLEYEPLSFDVENVLLNVQSDIWNARHRAWPTREGKIGPPCVHTDLPEPEVVVRERVLFARFPSVGVTLPPIELNGRV